MSKMVISHHVEDADKWLQFKAEREEAINGLGGGNVVDHVAEDGSKVVAVTCEVDDVAAVMAAIASPPPELGEAMQRHGVVPPLTIFVEK
jgi:hypothetical protein